MNPPSRSPVPPDAAAASSPPRRLTARRAAPEESAPAGGPGAAALPAGAAPGSLAPGASRPVDAAALAWMLLLTLLWGLNTISVRVLVQGMAPLMASGLRGALALAVLLPYGLVKGERLGLGGRAVGHAALNGLIFTTEFIFFYTAARFTTGAHLVLYINTAPFFVAIGAHYLLPGDRLHAWKVAGLVLAFCGVAALFLNNLLTQSAGMWLGDSLMLVAASLWAANTLYTKRFLSGRMSAFRMLYIQIAVSTPLLLLASWLTEAAPFHAVTALTVGILLFQGVITVAMTYMLWMHLVTRYPASVMQSFTFLTPVWGVFMAALLLGEQVQALMLVSLALVGLGIYLVSRPRRVRAA